MTAQVHRFRCLCPILSTTPITAMGCWQCLSLSVVQLKGKHYQKTHCRNVVVDTFRLFLSCQQQKNTKSGAAVTSLRTFVRSSAFSVAVTIVYALYFLFFQKYLQHTLHITQTSFRQNIIYKNAGTQISIVFT